MHARWWVAASFSRASVSENLTLSDAVGMLPKPKADGFRSLTVVWRGRRRRHMPTAAANVATALSRSAKTKRRNILFITADQWRGDCLGANGHPVLKTPNLDKLAADGTLFVQHYTNCVPCSPAGHHYTRARTSPLIAWLSTALRSTLGSPTGPWSYAALAVIRCYSATQILPSTRKRYRSGTKR